MKTFFLTHLSILPRFTLLLIALSPLFNGSGTVIALMILVNIVFLCGLWYNRRTLKRRKPFILAKERKYYTACDITLGVIGIATNLLIQNDSSGTYLFIFGFILVYSIYRIFVPAKEKKIIIKK